MIRDYSVETIHSGTFRQHRDLIEELTRILQSSYENPRDALVYSLNRCATLYLARGKDGEVLSFYLVNWETIQLEDNSKLNAVYTGLCATKNGYKNTGVASILYFRFAGDYMRWREEQDGPILMWGITASPLGWMLARRMQGSIGDFEPNSDLTYSPLGERIARAIFRKMKWTRTAPANHPFAASQAAVGRFSKSETRRLKRICEEQNITVFDDLDIDPRNGDRLLFICFRP